MYPNLAADMIGQHFKFSCRAALVLLCASVIALIKAQSVEEQQQQQQQQQQQHLFRFRFLSPGPNDIILAKSAPIFFEALAVHEAARDVDPSGLSVCLRINGSSTPQCTAYNNEALLEFTHQGAPGKHVMEAWLTADGATTHAGHLLSNHARTDFSTATAAAADLLLGPDLDAPRICGGDDMTCSVEGGTMQPRTVVAISGGHDANVAVTKDGRVVFVLELERFFEKRYMAGFGAGGTYKEVTAIWRQVRDLVTRASNVTTFDVGVNVALDKPGGITDWHSVVSRVVRQTFPARQWIEVDHHRSHALLALFDSPFANPLVLSFDGGGNDGFFLIFHGDRQNGTLDLVDEKVWNLGTAYMRVGAAMSEIFGTRKCKSLIPCGLGFAGKMMGYLALGKVRSEWLETVREFFLDVHQPLDQPFPIDALVGFPVSEANATATAAQQQAERDLAATAQEVFEDIVLSVIEDALNDLAVDTRGRSGDGAAKVDGIALTGGCALNVLANSRIQKQYPELPVYVPAAPSDCGLAVGAAWHVHRPPAREPLQYMGFDLWDADKATTTLDALGATTVGVSDVAELLADRKVIGVIRGRQEFGPRALGHRSLLAYPFDDMKDRMNRLKVREWYRPVAPVFPLDAVQQFSNVSVASPYMSFAPELLEDLDRAIPAVVHFDRTARPQTVSPEEDSWLYELLHAVGRSLGYPILINTSFNTRGKPILNRLSEAIDLLVDLVDLDYILVENRLVSKAQAQAYLGK